MDNVWFFPERPALKPYYRTVNLGEDKRLTYAQFFHGLLHGPWDGSEKLELMRWVLEQDLFLFCYFCLGRRDINSFDKPFLVKACQMVESGPMTDTVDLWARGHFKSSIITQGLTLQRLLKIPDLTCGIFSHTRPISKSFMRPIKRALEESIIVRECWPDRVWKRPSAEAPSWSMDDGITLKRSSQSNTASLEAWGLIDKMPASKHFFDRIYDDVVTEESVSTPEQMEKAENAFRLSDNLGTPGGNQRIIGTIYSHGDYYSKLRHEADNGIYPWVIRVYPWYDLELYEQHNGMKSPILLTAEEIVTKQVKQGPYNFACFGAGTKVLMADWSLKNIEHVQPGDMVVGFNRNGPKQDRGYQAKARLVPTRVVATNKRTAPAVQSNMENGVSLVHTPDHKFWTGRTGDDGHKEYAELGFKQRRQVASLCKVLDVHPFNLTREQEWWSGYLGGMFDGEGSVSSYSITMTQSREHNPSVCKNIEKSLSILEFDYGVHERENKTQFYIRGGRQSFFRFLNTCFPAKRQQVVDGMFKYSSRNFGMGNRVPLVSQKSIGLVEVFNIQTETGNYIANGFCSKNCQMELDPSNEENREFKTVWLKYYRTLPDVMNLYLLVDPNHDRKKHSDWTVFALMGLDALGNRYLVDMVRDHMNLTDRWETLKAFVQAYPDCRVFYERYGMQSDVQHFQTRQLEEGIYFIINEMAGQVSKEQRCRRLQGPLQQGKVLLPETGIWYHGQDLVKIFVDQEYTPFPYPVSWDMLDAISRIEDPEVGATRPVVGTFRESYNQMREEELDAYDIEDI